MNIVDATNTSAWNQLAELSHCFNPDLRGWFASDTNRALAMTLSAADLHVDLSKNLTTPAIMKALISLACELDLTKRRDAMFAGERINITEDRAVLHTALRRPRGDQLVVDGVDVVTEVHAVLDRVYDFARQVRGGKWHGASGKRIHTVVNIGIGGSDLGPAMVYEALRPYASQGLECRFVSNIDPSDLAEKTRDLDPERTLFIVASKTFTTLETLTNARLARQWLWDGLAAKGVIGASEDSRAGAVAKHFVAVSTALDKVAEFGIDPANAFGFWDWVGGRYSVGSAVGTALAVAFGPEVFAEFLAGMHALDRHFQKAPLSHNLPVVMGLLGVWYRDFLGLTSHAVLPYTQYLHRFAAYLQQLTMESNGKRVGLDGRRVPMDTGEIYWGEPGTNGQHAFYQLLHQGTQIIPADFIGVAMPTHPSKDGEVDVHELLLANCFAQTKALAFGKTEAEVRAEGTPDWLVPHRVFPGNRPSTTILAPALTPSVVGQLIALYEHITFVQGVIWGINPFDQWGVELGKQLALQIAPAIQGDQAAYVAQDPSTQGLIAYYRNARYQ
ncbi:MAG: glucose-6-phosphate isomerase [Propionibacteriaceae bacterium]|jgi:glucose-6-phosphate isomerase|nr:glucose-6-phosphate isomerase [Propionibacteriaceae bacterium]